MILTRSPYYLTIPWNSPSSGVTPDKYVLQLFVWDGLKTDEPTIPDHEIENKNPLARVGSTKVNISNYINDFLDVSLISSNATGNISSGSAVWVKSQVIYYIGGVAQSAEFVNIDLAIRGYGYGIEGENTTIPSNNILAHGSSVNVSKDTVFILPIKISETENTDVTILSYPNNEINESYTIGSTNNSSILIKSIIVNCSDCRLDSSVQITVEGVVYELIIKEELRYTPIDVRYLNKYGQLYSVTFFKEKIESLNVESESYENDSGQPINGVHQYNTYNTIGKSDFKIKTGFIREENNELIKQLYLSNKVWQYDNGRYIPLARKSKKLEYQTRQKERLLNYEIEFDYAFNEINDI